MFRNSIMGTTYSVSTEAWLATEREKIQYQRERDERDREKQERKEEKQEKISNENKLKTKQMVMSYGEYIHYCHDLPRWLMGFPRNRERCATARMKFLDSGVDLVFNDTQAQEDMVQFVKNMK